MEALAARIAADFASLLAPVLGGVTLLGEELPQGHVLRTRLESLQQAAAAARAFAQRLALLDPQRQLALHRAEIGELAREWLSALRARLRPDITVEMGPAGASETVRVDRRLLEQAMVELALNAQDAMPAGGVLHVDVARVESEGRAGELPAGRWVRVRLADGGCGMEPALLKHACMPFVTTKVPGGGLGLGLSVVHATVRQHGGRLDIESRPGVGTAVSVYLPCHITETHPRDFTPAMGTAIASPGTDAAGYCVLVVEDNAMVRRSIEVTLRSAGYQVTSVESGERCLEALARLDEPFHLLISDVVMPEMSGEQLVARVRELRPALPVLFISGYDRATLARRRPPGGNEHFLQKPFDSEDLFVAVRKALAAPSGK
ncbi:MAG: response regulator [Deltaproteobacteria bacterium]|nr:response regulator [Deltaproteobacteria bacterium]